MLNFAANKLCVMRKSIFFAAAAFLICILMMPTGCTDKKPKPVDTLAADSLIADTTGSDSTQDIIEATPMPKAADELFDDFVFNFAANRKLQRKRIVFPLKVYRNGKLEKEIPETKWKMEHFFMRQQYYTLIFDNMRQMEVVKDTTIDQLRAYAPVITDLAQNGSLCALGHETLLRANAGRFQTLQPGDAA